MTCRIRSCVRRACRKPSAQGLCIGHALLWHMGPLRGTSLSLFIASQTHINETQDA